VSKRPKPKEPYEIPKVEANGYIDYKVDFNEDLSQKKASENWDEYYGSEESSELD
jgi:hypothetical protein